MSDVEFGLRLRADVSESKKLGVVADDLNKVKAAARDTGAALGNTSDEAQKMIDKYDPLGAKLRSLKADFDSLSKAAASGNVGAGDDKRYDTAMARLANEIKNTKAEIDGYGNTHTSAMDKVVAATEKGMFATVGAKRELMVLGHEAMTGNFSRMPGSFMVLAESMSITEALMSPMTLGIVGLGAAALTMAEAFSHGHEEMVAMNNALATTSNYAGMTRSSMRELAEGMTADGTVTIGVAKQVVTELVASGQLGTQSLQGVAKLAGDYAKATGKDIEKVAPELVKLFADPAKGAEELNKSMHFLSAENQEYINHLVRIGDVESARKVLLDELNQVIPSQASNVGTLVAIWNSWKQSISGVGDALASIGRTQTTGEQIRALQSRLGGIAGQYGTNLDGLSNAVKGTVLADDVNRDMEQLALLQRQAKAEQDKAAAASQAAAQNERIASATKEADKSSTHQIQVIRDQLALLQSIPSSDDVERRKFELNKQIEGIQRSMGAEAVAVDRARTEGELKLRDLAIKKGEAENDAALKLRTITQEEHDAAATAFALRRNDAQTIAAIRERSYATLTAQEKVSLDYRIKELAVIREQIAAQGAAKIAEDRAAVERSKAKADLIIDRTQMQWNKENADAERGMAIMPKLDASLLAALEKVGAVAERDGLEFKRLYESGELSWASYQEEMVKLADATDTQTERVKALNAEQERLNGSWEYGAAKALQKYSDAAKDVASSTERAFTRGFSAMEDAAVQFATTGKINFTSMANSIIADMIRMQARQAMSPMLAGAGNWLTGLFKSDRSSSAQPGASGGFGDVFVDVAHTGALIGHESPSQRSVPSSLFSGAPRYHTGGIASDEVPTILQKGEGVFTAGQMRALGAGLSNANSGANININVINQASSDTQVSPSVKKNEAGGFDVELIVRRVVLGDLTGNGPIGQAIGGRFGLSARAY